MALSDLANIVLSTTGPALTQVGFGTLLCAGYHTHFAEHTRTYTDTAGMITDGFAATDPLYKMVAKAFAQNPRPVSVKVGRLEHPATQVLEITPLCPIAEVTVYKIRVTKATSAVATFTSDSSPSVAEVTSSSTGLAKAINDLAISGVTAVDGTTKITITMAAGAQVYLSEWDYRLLQIQDVTPDYTATIKADLDAIRAEDADWYGFAIDVNSAELIEAAAEWASSDGLCIFFANSSEYLIPTTSSSDIASDLQTDGQERVGLWYSENDTGSYAGVAAAAERLVHDPGAIGAGGTFFGKTLVGVTADGLTPTRKSKVISKHANAYITTAGRNHTLGGITPGGEFIDTVRGLDWFRIRTEERIAAALLDNEKVPFTDGGISVIGAAIEAQFTAAVNSGVFASDPAPVLTLPKAADVPTNDKAARLLTGIRAEATLAGAIHFVGPVTITVSS